MSNTKVKEQLKGLLHRLALASVCPIPKDRIPLYLNSHLVGHIQQKDAAFCAKSFHFIESSDTCVIRVDDHKQADTRLAVLAQTFKQTSRVRAWRDELISVVNVSDYERKHPLALIERAMARPLAISTFAVHLNPFTKDGRLWVGQRAMTKSIGPGYWDNCAAGMVASDEELIPAMLRESQEEAGLNVKESDLRYLARHKISRPVTEGWMTEHTIMYSMELADDVVPHNLDGEVQAFELLAPEEVVDRADHGEFTFESSLSVLLAVAERQGMSPELENYL